MLYRLLVAFLLSMALIGVVWGDANVQTNYIYKMDQSVTGNGFFSSYHDITTNDLTLSNLDHGSGSYSGESDYNVQNKAEQDLSSMEYIITADQIIGFNKSTDFAYAAKSFDLGKSFHAAIQSKGQEQTCLKNYDGSNGTSRGGASINALFNRLDVLSGTTSANLFFKSLYVDDEDQISFNSTGFIRLNLDSSFTGKGHIGVLDLSQDAGNPSLIDEDYLGTFALSKKMSVELRDNWWRKVDDWLPCCSGGWNDLRPSDKKYLGSTAKGVFDCTCFSPAGQIAGS